MKCGIDLGTMFSSIALCNASDDKLVAEHIGLSVADGGYQVRSALYFDPKGRVVVGASALNMLTTEPNRVVQWIKRDMGEDIRREFPERAWTPAEISAEILKVLKKDAEAWVEDKLESAVVCVPAWFGDRQREATRQAAELAEIPLLELLAEPSAAALAVSLDRPDDITDRDLLVYDLGGGTFDVVVIRTRRGAGGRLDVQTLCLAGDRKLGGHDWDMALAHRLAERCREQFGHDPEHSEDRREWYHLLDQVERNKREFSKGSTEVTIPCDLRGHALPVTLEEFNEVTEPLLDSTAGLVEQVLKEAEEKHGVKRDDLVVLLCGGSSKLPEVRPMLTRVVGHEPLQLARTNPELLVVRGAAYAAHLAEASAVDGVSSPLTVTQRFKAVGVEVLLDEGLDGEPRYGNEVVLPQGTPPDTPCRQEFEVSEDDQTELEVTLLQGDDPEPERCERIGSLVIRGLPNRKAGARVDVTIWYDASGILQAQAVDRQTGAEAKASLQR